MTDLRKATQLRGHAAAAFAVLTLLLTGCGGQTETSATDPAAQGSAAQGSAGQQQSSPANTPPPAPDQSSGTSDGQAAAPGRYVDWDDFDADRAAYADTDVVLFFHAPWCPSCRATEDAIDADGVPDGLTIVKVDFDSATKLREEYGVTVQHTFVHIDADGAAKKKWTGTLSGVDIAAELA